MAHTNIPIPNHTPGKSIPLDGTRKEPLKRLTTSVSLIVFGIAASTIGMSVSLYVNHKETLTIKAERKKNQFVEVSNTYSVGGC